MMTWLALLFSNFLFGAACACESVLTTDDFVPGRAVQFFGGASNSRLGYTVNAAGDLNGDGFGDFAISAPNDGTLYEGATYVIFGRSAASWASATFNFSAEQESPDSWIRISGVKANALLGQHGIASGDFNADGFSDLAISSQKSMAFVAFGHGGAWRSFNTSEIESGAVAGFTAVYTASNGFVVKVGNAGDLNGDGIDDLLFTAGTTAHVVFGLPGSSRTAFNLSLLDGENGFSLVDTSTILFSSNAMGSVGDVNGDGLADFSLGSFDSTLSLGHAYFLFARNVSASGQRWSASFNLSSELDGTNGFVVNGPDVLGFTIAGAGDVNKDGFGDIFIGSNDVDGGAWIVFGHAEPWTSPLDDPNLDGSNGLHFLSFGEKWGYSGGGAGDVNGDGFDDIIIGGPTARNSTGTTIGAVAILFGRAGSWPAELNRSEVVGSVGFIVEGPSEGSEFGGSARGAGDVNGDGLGDFIAGATHFGAYKGFALLMFGADDHCAVCSNFTDACLLCDDGFILNGTICESNQTAAASSSQATEPVVVVIETGGGGGSAVEVAAEIAQLLGVDVGQISVVEITPGTFEVTVINEEVAQQLVILVEKCIEEDAASGAQQ